MFFTIVDGRFPAETPPGTAYLITDNWDDWFSYKTQFNLLVVDEQGQRHQPGAVKIGQRGMQGSQNVVNGVVGQRSPNLLPTFDALGEEYFSLGQDETYYETLNRLSDPLKRLVLEGLRDVAVDLDLFAQVEHEDVVSRSLLRYVQASTVRGRLNRLTQGNARLSEFHFTYTLPVRGEDVPPVLSFDVLPDVQPPTNVHVLIGRNGVGKTRLMQGLAGALLGRPNEDGSVGTVEVVEDVLDGIRGFAGLVLVSFSAFDDFDLQLTPNDSLKSVQVGLRVNVDTDQGDVTTTKTPAQLAADFVGSLDKCRVGLRAERWAKAVETLGQDDLFAAADVASLLGLPDDEWKAAAKRLFTKLSSGHKIVLLTITKLVEHVDERTLVLLDEPEAHLHPPLLSAFVRSLSDLLSSRNGVAFIATHSPVVLQEVPRSCVWKIRRDGTQSQVDRPEDETFAENVSDLTREVFHLEITASGFHHLIAEAVAMPGITYEAVLDRFQGQLGAEGRALARALLAARGGGVAR